METTPMHPFSVTETFKRPSAFLPIVMSVCAMAVIIVHLVRFGLAREADEGPSAHLWQLMMGAQLPIVGLFLLRWLPRSGRSGLVVLGVQVVAAVAAMAPVFFLKW
jgi:hypothetical protein